MTFSSIIYSRLSNRTVHGDRNVLHLVHPLQRPLITCGKSD